MFSEKLEPYTPWTWLHEIHLNDYLEVSLSSETLEYIRLSRCLTGNFIKEISRITCVKNPFLYGHFLLKKAEYESRGRVTVKELYHCTAANKIDSILKTNLDWRKACRVKFGQGVSFSPFAFYANQEASKYNGLDRAMIVADVLVGNIQQVSSSCTIPNPGFDTTCGNSNKVYVKFNDNEFYPKYVIYYESKEIVYRRRRQW